MLVTPDGHDPEEHSDFISVEKTVDDTAQWLKERGIDHLDAMYGLSFGGVRLNEQAGRQPAEGERVQGSWAGS